MSTEYSKIATKIWNSQTFSRLGEDAKFLWFYLLTCPHRNMIGMYVLKIGYALEDLKWTESPERFAKAFDELLTIQLTNGCQGLIKYDEENKLLLIKNFLEHNPLKNPNQIIAAQKKLSELPFSVLFQDLKLFTEQLGKQLYKPLVEQLGKPVTVSVTVTVEEKEPPNGGLPSDQKKGNQHYSENVKDYSEVIIRKCNAIEQLPSKKAPFNPHQWVQQKVNQKGHPGAIDETLGDVIKGWEGIKNVWAVIESIWKIKNQNWHEKDAFTDHEQHKKDLLDLVEALKRVGDV